MGRPRLSTVAGVAGVVLTALVVAPEAYGAAPPPIPKSPDGAACPKGLASRWIEGTEAEWVKARAPWKALLCAKELQGDTWAALDAKDGFAWMWTSAAGEPVLSGGFDAAGKRDGTWTDYGPGGRPAAETIYTAGRESGQGRFDAEGRRLWTCDMVAGRRWGRCSNYEGGKLRDVTCHVGTEHAIWVEKSAAKAAKRPCLGEAWIAETCDQVCRRIMPCAVPRIGQVYDEGAHLAPCVNDCKLRLASFDRRAGLLSSAGIRCVAADCAELIACGERLERTTR